MHRRGGRVNFEDSPEEAAYRAEVRAWLDINMRELKERYPDLGPPELDVARAWQARKAQARYARIAWPVEWGGGGGTALQQAIFDHEESRCGAPQGYFGIGLGMCMPTLMKFGSAEVQRRFIGPALKGEEIWCQLFSEPSAGSDIAGLRTRATRQGEGWRISGQKVWTTGAHYSDYGLLLARSDFDAPKHQGLTMFWVDMRAPGIDIRAIDQMTGRSEFNEVYLSDVMIADDQRIGPIGEGWKVALVTLMNERVEGGKERGPSLEDILGLARSIPRARGTLLDDPMFRQRLAVWYIQAEGLRFTRLRSLTALSRGETPGPEMSIGKLVAANRLQDLTERLVEYQDQFGLIGDPDYALCGGRLQRDLLHAPSLRIAGGTDEILKNIIAERVLGLPGDVRVDKTASFKELISRG
jgi:alkylation response protein AidB-like acyl-CoA dehydrogenase